MHSLTSPSESESAPSPTFEVSAVRSTPQGVIYRLDYFPPAGARVFEVNERVGQEIDGVKRDLHSRLHRWLYPRPRSASAQRFHPRHQREQSVACIRRGTHRAPRAH